MLITGSRKNIGITPSSKIFDFDAPSDIRGVPGSAMKLRGANVHQDITNQWAYFRALNPNATRAQVEEQANTVDGLYGDYFWRERK